MSFLGFFYKLCHASGIGLGRIPTGLLPYSSRDTQGTRTYPGHTPYDCVISADYRTRIGRAPEGDRTISDDDRPMSLRHPIKNFPPLSTHCRPIIFRISPEALSSPEKNLTTETMTDRFSPALRHRRTPPICRYPPAAGLNVTEVLATILCVWEIWSRPHIQCITHAKKKRWLKKNSVSPHQFWSRPMTRNRRLFTLA